MFELLHTVLPILALLLFVLGVVVGAVRFFKETPDSELKADSPDRQELSRVLLACLLAGILYQAVFLLVGMYNAPGSGVSGALQKVFISGIDARHYVSIAQYGYGDSVAFDEQNLMIVFFPLFPQLLRIVNPLGLFDWYLVGTLVQLPLFGWAGVGLYKLICCHFDRRTASWTLTFLLASPGAFFFFAPMTESLFLALTVTFVLLLEKKRYVLCGLAGLLAALCRSPGALLLGLALVYFAQQIWHRSEQPHFCWLCPILGPAVGLGFYFAINKAVYGNWFQYSIYQKEHWHQQMGFFPDTVRYQLEYARNWWTDKRISAIYISVTCIICILIELLILLLAAKKLPVHYLAFGLAYAAFTCGATWLLSAPRYAVGLFCLPAALAAVCKNKWLRLLVLSMLLVCSGLYLRQFLLRGPIY